MKTVSLQAFYDMLEQHDWYWVFADDRNAYENGSNAESKLNAIAGQSPEHHALMAAYHDHMWSGRGFATEQKPKPERPKD